jgi:GrpB-like predicted nucleotidyltransferase (UPF0157 family)
MTHRVEIRPRVEILPYDPAWTLRAAEEGELVREALAAETVEHIGSTAVRGLAAKPIVDLLAGLRSLELSSERISAMDRLGYEFLGEYGLPGRLYFRKGAPRTFHVHAVEGGGDHWTRHLAVRDYLRAHPSEAEGYAAEKRRAAKAAADEWETYCDEKAAYVEALERRALAWRASGEGLL